VTNSGVWKLLGAVAAIVAAAMVVSMYPDLKRYIKIETM
jgi:hypothetical protein